MYYNSRRKISFNWFFRLNIDEISGSFQIDLTELVDDLGDMSVINRHILSSLLVVSV